MSHIWLGMAKNSTASFPRASSQEEKTPKIFENPNMKLYAVTEIIHSQLCVSKIIDANQVMSLELAINLESKSQEL